VPVLIVGAAALLLRGLDRVNYKAVGLVDDDPEKQNAKIGGVPVLARVDELGRLAQRHGVREILIAVPSATGAF
jgi:FlaA1/EpsC-like NDP-sugar epimerase